MEAVNYWDFLTSWQKHIGYSNSSLLQPDLDRRFYGEAVFNHEACISAGVEAIEL
ncbi:MAG: hypothetical protein ACRD4P_00950 [Bryobacteraceae bacterium]